MDGNYPKQKKINQIPTHCLSRITPTTYRFPMVKGFFISRKSPWIFILRLINLAG